MPPRPALPADDLYARLGVPSDASPEAIEVAWRGLLRRHHPDVAGPAALDLAKRINVAHDWLSDSGLRERYDRERSVARIRTRTPARTADPVTRARPARRRPTSVADRVQMIVDRSGRLTLDDLDRLALAEPAPIAFLATLRRFVPADARDTLAAAERSATAGLPPAARRDPAIRDAIVGKLAETVLGDALDELLGPSGAARARERLARGWDAAVGQPRYGPAGEAVERLVSRLGALDAYGRAALAATGARDRLGEAPWPAGTSPEEDEALRVSSELAGRAAAGALGPGPGAVAARAAAARIAHLLVLRHAIPPAQFERLAAPWLGDLAPRVAPWSARVRRR